LQANQSFDLSRPAAFERQHTQPVERHGISLANDE
jgi:hypothetical protein